MRVLHEWFIRLSENELLLFIGCMTEKDNMITLIDRHLKGELKMYTLKD